MKLWFIKQRLLTGILAIFIIISVVIFALLKSSKIPDGPNTTQSRLQGTVRGKVIDTSGNPVKDVSIIVTDWTVAHPNIEVFTNASGDYEWPLPDGTFKLSTYKIGYLQQEKQVSLTSGQLLSLDFIISTDPDYVEYDRSKASKITIEGQIDCLPHKDTEGIQTMECAIGLKTKEGIYYALGGEKLFENDFDITSGAPGAGEFVKVTGFLQEVKNSKYAVAGAIEVLSAEKADMQNYAGSGARTLYEVFVMINPLQLSVLKSRLEGRGCLYNYQGEITNNCIFADSKIVKLNENGLEIFPHGPGFGPVSFIITDSKIWAQKDLDGTPDKEKYKIEVREDIENLGNIVQIMEDTWQFTKIEYPWNVIY